MSKTDHRRATETPETGEASGRTSWRAAHRFDHPSRTWTTWLDTSRAKAICASRSASCALPGERTHQIEHFAHAFGIKRDVGSSNSMRSGWSRARGRSPRLCCPRQLARPCPASPHADFSSKHARDRPLARAARVDMDGRRSHCRARHVRPQIEILKHHRVFARKAFNASDWRCAPCHGDRGQRPAYRRFRSCPARAIRAS